MASFESIRRRVCRLVAALFLLGCFLPIAEAQQQVSGFAVDRFYQSAPGGGWFVMDDLDISGRVGGAVSATSGYERNPLVITSPDGKQKLAVVSQEAFLDIGGSVTHDRFRGYVNFPIPLVVTGTSGTLGPYQFTAPSLTLGTNPDSIIDPRIGVDVRLFGQPGGLLRLGAGAQAIIPSGNRADYVTDARYRGMFRFLAAGDAGAFRYAGQLGIHVRPLNEAPVPDSPNGNEFLYGTSGGRSFGLSNNWAVIAGPEIFGETAFHASSPREAGAEALLTGRFERTGTGRNLRIKLGFGHALAQNFGAAQWRIVCGVELFGHN
jgi:hypothetical protein